MSTLRVNNMTNVGGTGPTYVSGGIIQVKSTTKTDAFTTTSTTLTDVTGLSVDITPKSANSKILVTVDTNVSITTVTTEIFQLVRNSLPIGVSTSGSANGSFVTDYSSIGSGNGLINVSFSYLDSPATTSATTYKVQVLTGGGTLKINGRANDAYMGAISTITVMEVAA